MYQDVFIQDIEYYIPDNRVKVQVILDEISEDYFIENKLVRKEFNEKFIQETELNEISIFHTGEMLKELDRCVDTILVRNSISPQDIDYIVFGNDMLQRYHNNISVAHYLKYKYGMEKSVLLPFSQACTAGLLATGLAGKLFDNNRKSNMLILMGTEWCDYKSRFMKFSVRGDGCGVALVSNYKGKVKLDFWNSFNWGKFSAERMSDITKSNKDERENMITCGITFIKESMELAGASFEEVEQVFVSNVRKDVFSRVYSTFLEIDRNKFFLKNVAKGGHMCDLDLFRNMKDYLDDISFPKEKKLMIYTPDVEDSADINYHFMLFSMVKEN